MRGSYIQFIGYVLASLGGALALSGVLALFLFEEMLGFSLRYSTYPPIMIKIGAIMSALGLAVIFMSRGRGVDEVLEGV